MSDPFVTLTGKQYAVPLLVPKQQKVVIPFLMKLAKDIRIVDGKPTFDFGKITPEFIGELTEAVFWGAIWPNDKKASLDGFSETAVSYLELITAINVIREQTGIFRSAPEGASAGESKPEGGG